MVMQSSSTVKDHTVASKRSGLVNKVLMACGFAVATVSLVTVNPAQASLGVAAAEQAAVEVGTTTSGILSISGNAEKKAEAKAAREKKKAERAARREEKLAKAKANKKDDKVAKADEDMSDSDDPLEGL